MDKWDHRFMDMTRLVAGWSSCFQPGRAIGAVIVKDKRVMTTGYNGAPAGIRTCKERGECLRRKLDIPSGTRQEVCYAIHAEQNAIIQAAAWHLHRRRHAVLHAPAPFEMRASSPTPGSAGVYEQGYPMGSRWKFLPKPHSV